MVFDGGSNALDNGIGVVIISPEAFHSPFIARLCFNCTNNMADYETCIMGPKAAIDLRTRILSVFGEWDTKHPNLILYKEHVLTLIPYFEEITFEHFHENKIS